LWNQFCKLAIVVQSRYVREKRKIWQEKKVLNKKTTAQTRELFQSIVDSNIGSNKNRFS
jgi:hypothetical protein